MKSKTHFRFKQFSVAHDQSTHKIGTDGVLLGAWVDVGNVRYALDIGTGTGIIALMLAQRTEPSTHIHAVEIEKEDAQQASQNVKHSPWPLKIEVIHSAVQQLSVPEHKYDLIVSNPPYFINSWKPPAEKRSHARHADRLTFEELLAVSVRLLQKGGKLAVIFPYQEGMQFIEKAQRHYLFLARQLSFRSRRHKPIERLLLEFVQKPVKTQTEELVLYGTADQWSAEYRELTRDFYLKI